ncbi:MAG: hypothetical protein CMQ41_03265 [Gammaproteobacteria bacterium]|nr:hypothetical protein [Gammaproteobacteria bacterium]
MKSIIATLGFIVFLSGCESTDNDGIPAIRSQRQADAYNETVSSPGERMVCERERVIGSNIRRLVCMTVAQRERLQQETQELLDRGLLVQ